MEPDSSADLNTIETTWSIRQVLDMVEILDIKAEAVAKYLEGIK